MILRYFKCSNSIMTLLSSNSELIHNSIC
jgi:hypothetical protein